MSLSILEVLENAEANLCSKNTIPGISNLVGSEQLRNAINLLEKGYDVFDDYNEIVKQYGGIENVPDKD